MLVVLYTSLDDDLLMQSPSCPLYFCLVSRNYPCQVVCIPKGFEGLIQQDSRELTSTVEEPQLLLWELFGNLEFYLHISFSFSELIIVSSLPSGALVKDAYKLVKSMILHKIKIIP